MNPVPLHPAIVHFPIVLVLLGAAVSILSIFFRRSWSSLLTASLLGLGALGAALATSSGESDGERVEHSLPSAKTALESHETWAERTLALATLAAVLAITTCLLTRAPRTARALAIGTAFAAGMASWGIYETGRQGGVLVYQHGAGLPRAASHAVNAAARGQPLHSSKSSRHDD